MTLVVVHRHDQVEIGARGPEEERVGRAAISGAFFRPIGFVPL
jgi:hypothetical protein